MARIRNPDGTGKLGEGVIKPQRETGKDQVSPSLVPQFAPAIERLQFRMSFKIASNSVWQNQAVITSAVLPYLFLPRSRQAKKCTDYSQIHRLRRRRHCRPPCWFRFLLCGDAAVFQFQTSCFILTIIFKKFKRK